MICANLDCQLGEKPFIIRPLVSADVLPVRALHSALLPLRYPSSFFTHLLIQSHTICLVAYTASNAPIAFISAAVKPSSASRGSPDLLADSETPGAHIQILTLGVLPSYRNRGLGHCLVRNVVSRLIDCSVAGELTQAPPPSSAGVSPLSRREPLVALVSAHVSTSNARALEFYKRLGLVPSLEIRELYTGVSSGSRDAFLVVGRISVADTLVS